MQKLLRLTAARKTFSCFALTYMALFCQQRARSEEPPSNRKLDSIVADELRGEAIAETRIRRALLEPTSIEFIETPLIDVIDYLEEQHGIKIELKTSALDTIGLGSDTPVTRDLKGISLKSALTLMLSDLELTYVIQQEVLQITTPEDAEAYVVTRVYDVDDWLGEDRSSEILVEAVTMSCFPNDSHGHSTISEFRGRFIVNAPYNVQERVARLLAMLRATQPKAEASKVLNSLGLYPLEDRESAGTSERVKEPKPTKVADPFGEGVPAPRKPKASPKPVRDPFGGEKADPFGGGAGADPFGGGADPFGGGAGEDPFGGGIDPPGVGGTDPFGKDVDPFE